MSNAIPAIENLEERLMMSCSCGPSIPDDAATTLNFDTPADQEAVFEYNTGDEKHYNGDTRRLGDGIEADIKNSGAHQNNGSAMEFEEAVVSIEAAMDETYPDVKLLDASMSGATVEFTTAKDATKTISFVGDAIEDAMPSIILGVPADEIGDGVNFGNKASQFGHFIYDSSIPNVEAHSFGYSTGNASDIKDVDGLMDDLIAPPGHSDSKLNLEEACALTEFLVKNQDDPALLADYGVTDLDIGCDYVKVTIEGKTSLKGVPSYDTILLSGDYIKDKICEINEADDIRELDSRINLKPKGTREGYIDFRDVEENENAHRVDKRSYGAFIGNPVHFEKIDIGGTTLKDIQKGNGNGAKLNKVEAEALIAALEGVAGKEAGSVAEGASIVLTDGPDGIKTITFTDYDKNGDVRSTNVLHIDL